MRSIFFALVVMFLMGSVAFAGDTDANAPTGAIVTGGPSVDYVDNGYPTSWSSVTYQVLYSKMDAATGWWSVWSYDRKSSTCSLVSTKAANAVWNPDGTKCAYWEPFKRVGDDELCSLVIKNIRSGATYRVNAYTANYSRRLSWDRPDQICFTMVRNGHSAIAEFAISTHTVKQITPWGGPSDYMDPVFAKGYYYYTSANYGEGLVQIESGCTTVKRIILKQWGDTPLRCPILTPAGPIITDGHAVYWWESNWFLQIECKGSSPVLSPDWSMIGYASWDGCWYIAPFTDFGLG